MINGAYLSAEKETIHSLIESHILILKLFSGIYTCGAFRRD